MNKVNMWFGWLEATLTCDLDKPKQEKGFTGSTGLGVRVCCQVRELFSRWRVLRRCLKPRCDRDWGCCTVGHLGALLSGWLILSPA